MKHVEAGEWSEWSDKDYRKNYSHRDWEVSAQVIPSRILRSKRTVEKYRWRKSAAIEDVFVKRYGEWDIGFSGWYVLQTDPVTKHNILQRTTGVYEEWQTRNALALEQEAIRGDYPPKTLVKPE